MTGIPLGDIAPWPAEDDSDGVERRWGLLASARAKVGFQGHDATPEVWEAVEVYPAVLDDLRHAVRIEGAREVWSYQRGAGRQRVSRRLYPAVDVRRLLARIDRVDPFLN